MRNNNEIIIIGAGITGLSLALLLSSFAKIKLIELRAPSKNSCRRYLAITRATELLFKKIKLWECIQTDVCQYAKMRIFDDANKSEFSFVADDFAEQNIGCIINQDVIFTNLYNKVKTNGNINLYSDVELIDHSCNLNCAILRTKKHGELVADLIIGADGKNSWLAKASSIPVVKSSYNHSALTAILQTEHPHDSTAVQKFSSNDIVAFLPMADSNDQVFLVWSGEPKFINNLASLNASEQKQIISTHSSSVLGNVMNIDNVSSHPLHKHYIKSFINARTVFIGDAAHTLHPLAGQGLNLGLLDVLELAFVLKENYMNKGNVYSYSSLRKFERSRKTQFWEMNNIIDGVKWLFSNEDATMRKIRKFGIGMFSNSKVLKQYALDYALGNIKRNNKLLEHL